MLWTMTATTDFPAVIAHESESLRTASSSDEGTGQWLVSSLWSSLRSDNNRRHRHVTNCHTQQQRQLMSRKSNVCHSTTQTKWFSSGCVSGWQVIQLSPVQHSEKGLVKFNSSGNMQKTTIDCSLPLFLSLSLSINDFLFLSQIV